MRATLGLQNKVPVAAHFGCLRPDPECFAGIAVMRDARAGRTPSLASDVKRRKRSSVVLMASRKGVIHLVGSPGGGFPSWPHALSTSMLRRWVIEGCERCQRAELAVCLSRSLVVTLLAAAQRLAAFSLMQHVARAWVPIA